MSEPLLQLRPQQAEFFGCGYKHAYALHRRRAGKSFLIASRCWMRMGLFPGRGCFVASASISTGQENILKEAEIWYNVIDKWRKLAAANGKKLTSPALNDRGEMLDIDALADLFEHSKLEARLYFDRGKFSRTKLLAANPRTARGFGGDIYLDECCFVEDYLGVLDAIEPIQQDNPNFEFWELSSPPADDSHPLYQILMPPEGMEFIPNARGNWYETEQGVPVHHFDAWDGELAGMTPFRSAKGEILTIAEARAAAVDRAAFDRNYLLLFNSSSTAAIARDHLIAAQRRGRALDCSALDLMGDQIILSSAI